MEFSNDKILDLLPYFGEIGEKLGDDLEKAFKQNNAQRAVIFTILKNIKKIKPEIHGAISEVLDIPLEEAKKMKLLKTINEFKKIFEGEDIKEILNFIQ